jgi:hypothetical protein
MAFFSRNLREDEDEVDNEDDVEVMVDAEDEKRLGGLLGAERMEGVGLLDAWRAPIVGRVDRALVVGCSTSGVSKYGSSYQYRSIMEETSSQEDMRDGLRRAGWRLEEHTEQSWSWL